MFEFTEKFIKDIKKAIYEEITHHLKLNVFDDNIIFSWKKRLRKQLLKFLDHEENLIYLEKMKKWFLQIRENETEGDDEKAKIRFFEKFKQFVIEKVRNSLRNSKADYSTSFEDIFSDKNLEKEFDDKVKTKNKVFRLLVQR